MNRTRFYGEAYVHDSEIVRRAVAQWVAANDLTVRVKVFGDQVIYEDETVYIFAEIGTEVGQQDCLLQGHLVAGLQAATERLRNLVNLFKQNAVEVYIDCMEVDDAGDEVSEEVRIK